MNIRYELIMLITLFLALFNLNSAAVARAGQGDGPSYLTQLSEERLSELFPEAPEQAEPPVQNRFDNALYQCHYQDQPVLPKSKRVIAPQSRLHRLCNGEAFTRDIMPKKSRRFIRGRHTFQDAKDREMEDERTEAAVSEYIESDYSETRDGLYTVLTKSKHKPVRTYGQKDSTHEEIAYSKDSADGIMRMFMGDFEINSFSIMYDKMRTYRPTNPYRNDPDRMLSYFGHYYLKSKGFQRFLASWKKSSGNARYYISLDDVNRIRNEVDAATPFHMLSASNKQLFAKLAFVRNVLEIYGTMRFIMKPLGLVSDERRTAEEFLQAMYVYVMAVHKSNGKLALEPSVALNLIRAELFNFAYAECYPLNVLGIPRDEEERLKTHSEEDKRAHIADMIILFKAWCESAKRYIDPAVLSDVADKFYSFIKRSDNYDDGCQQRALD
ncbi:hypothetical protein PAPHI01_2007 [Pancytospora philotis]|nr:hypothetical protein PAPHI01_2007 [Pancytospora philotis]